ncbi:MAG: hypothetical protein NT007_17255 [Candidatus Kapabacteria bacterium]|nr:hypothetical protein [Candidatus Kapabacteria bacterium]
MQEITPLFAIDAEEMLESGFIEEAIELCIDGLSVYPEYSSAYYILALAYKKNGDFENYKQTVTKSSSLFPSSRAISALINNIENEFQSNDITEEILDLIPDSQIEESESPVNSEFETNIIDEHFEFPDSTDVEIEVPHESVIDENPNNSIQVIQTDENISELADIAPEAEIEDELEIFKKGILNDLIKEVENFICDDNKSVTESQQIAPEPSLEEFDLIKEFNSLTSDDSDLISDEIEEQVSEIEIIEVEYVSESVNIDILSLEEDPINSGMDFLKIYDSGNYDKTNHDVIRASNLALIPGLDFSPIKISKSKNSQTDVKSSNSFQKEEFFIPKDFSLATNITTKSDNSSVNFLIEKLDNFSKPDFNHDFSDNEFEIEEDYYEGPEILTDIMAEIYLSQDKFPEAIDVYSKLMIQNPDKKDFYLNKIAEIESISFNGN